MKKYHQLYFLACLSILSFSSCEKGIDLIEQDSTVYLPQSGATVQTALLGESVFNLGVYHAGLNQSNQNVTVTLGIDQAEASTFIAQNAGYEILPSNFYSLPAQTVTIGKGQDRQYYQIQLKNIDESFIDKKYILPLSIQSVDPNVSISATKKLAMLQFVKFRNVYETKYKAYGQTVLSGTADTDKLKIDEMLTSSSVNATTIKVKGAVTGLNLLLTVNNGQVQITGAVGSEAFAVSNTAGKTSTYVGEFSKLYQCNTGKFMLYYTYTSGGKQMDATVELKTWL